MEHHDVKEEGNSADRYLGAKPNLWRKASNHPGGKNSQWMFLGEKRSKTVGGTFNNLKRRGPADFQRKTERTLKTHKLQEECMVAPFLGNKNKKKERGSG